MATPTEIRADVLALHVALTKFMTDLNSFLPAPAPAPTPVPKESAQGTSLTSVAGAIYDASLVKWTLVLSATAGLQVARNDQVDMSTAKVTKLVYSNHTVYQTSPNSSSIGTPGWWSWNGTMWVDTNAP